MAVIAPPFRNPDNVDVLNAIRKNATVDYQKRIPGATKANVQDVVQNLLSNRPQMNEFVDSLVNRIGLVIAKNNIWSNPLSKFKRGMLEFGDTIEEINVGLIEAKRYDPDRDYLEKDIFGQERPDVQTSYHKVDRQDFYKISVNEGLLKRAFLDPNGLSAFVTKLMDAPTTSDNWDEFLLTTSLFQEYDRAGGFFYVNVPDVSSTGSDGNDARYTLRRMREMADNLKFISTHYNASGMPVAADPDELELFITPEANAALDVEALAGAFNIDKAEFASRTTVIPREHFHVDGAQAILTTRDFFVIADQRIDTTNVINPVGLHTNYFLHHWEVVSASRFVPAILFTTEPGTVINLDATPVTSIEAPTLLDANGNTVTDAIRGDLYQIVSEAVTTPAGGANNAVRFDIATIHAASTRVTQTGVFTPGLDENATEVTVNITAVDTYPPQIVGTIDIPIVGDKVTLWPNPSVSSDSDDDGLYEATPETLTVAADNTVTIPSVKGVQYQQAGANVNNGTVITITGATAFTAVARTGYEITPGATAAWNLSPHA